MKRPSFLIVTVLAAAAVFGAAPIAAAQGNTPRFLAKEDIILYGLGLAVEPAQQTVPKDIATIVSTFLQSPQLPDGVPAFAPDAEVVATLRGPSLAQPLELHTPPNTPFTIPALNQAGTYILDGIRLVSGGQVLLYGSPDNVRIDVIDKLLVTQVTARPLTADEIRKRGIVFDRSNFQAYNFSAAFAIQDVPVNINFSVVLPQVQGATDVGISTATVPTIAAPDIPTLKTIIPDTLKLQTRIPNLQVVGFALKVPTLAGQNLIVPPIPGVVVIPGDIGFLNQFFSVMLMVSNAAPQGSNLVVTDLKAQIVLPPGRDGQLGTPDDPLAMARLATGPSPQLVPIVQLGPDGVRNTSDDINQLGPQETGSAEYLVEGLREGSQVVEMQITGTLNGLPVGPVAVTGRAAGSVLVRNPKFTLTFTHPQVVNAGEPYSLDVTVTNTSESPANFVSVTLRDQNISGAALSGAATKQVDSIAPGDSALVSFDLVSKITGSVTAATLDSDGNVAGRFELKTAVGELGVPLSPASLVLPQEANALPAALRAAAIGLLGKAYAVATTPPAALPKDIQPFSRQIVIDNAVAVAEAGLRVTLHEPLADSALQLLMDFDGSDYARLAVEHSQPDDLAFAQRDSVGFDALRRKSVRGDVMAQAVASILADGVNALGVRTFHQQTAEKLAFRPAHVSVMIGGQAPLPYSLRLVDANGRRTGGSADASGKIVKEIPFSDVLTFSSGGVTTSSLAIVTTPDPGNWTVALDPIAGAAAAPVTISIVYPGNDGKLRQVVFDNVVAGTSGPLPPAPGDQYHFTISVGGAPGGTPLPSGQTAGIVEPPPSIVSIVQQPQADVLKCDANEKAGTPIGRVVAVLFSKEVTAASVQDRIAPADITNYTSQTNRVLGVALQPGRRIAFLALRDPVGPYVPTSIEIAGVSDVHGNVMPTQSKPVETVIDAGGVVSGRVLEADGTPIPNAAVRLFYLQQCNETASWVGISAKTADANGVYQWGFVGKDLPDRIVAIDPETDEFRDVRFNLQASAQHLTVDIVLLGRGTFEGRTLAEDGTPLANSSVRITSLTDRSQYSATTDASGRFAVGRIPVGNILVEAVNVAANAKTFISQAIPSAGSTTTADLILLRVDTTQTTIKTGSISGGVLRADGTTPVAGVPVIAWYQGGSQAGVGCPGGADECAVATANTVASGQFQMPSVTAGTLRVQAFDQTSLQQGEARIVVPAAGAAQVSVVLGSGVGTVHGSVVDAAGNPVANARVGGGLSIVTTGTDGTFVMTDVPVGRRDIVAVSDALGAQGQVTIDLVRAGEEVGATIVLQAIAGVAGTVFESDGITPVANVTVYLFKSDGNSQIAVVGSASTDGAGHYHIDKIPVGDYQASAFRSNFSDGNIRPVSLKFNNQVFRRDIVFRGAGGRVSGVALDADGQTPLRAAIGVSGDQPVIAGGMVAVGFQSVANFKITQTDIATGAYSFNGLWVGPFSVSAVGQFSPDPVTLSSVILAANASVRLDIRLQPTSSVSGIVYQPNGVTPAGANLLVTFKSDEVRVVCSGDPSSDEVDCETIPQGIQEEHVVTDDQGHYSLPIVNAGVFTITVEDPVTHKIGRTHGSVRAGEDGRANVRLLGFGNVRVNVFSSDGTTPIPGAKVVLLQTDYPGKSVTAIADASGLALFSGGDALTEGAFAVTATDLRNGSTARGSGKVKQDGEQVSLNIYLYDAWGTLAGHVFRPDGVTPVPNADVVVSNALGPLAFSVSDASGAYSLDYIPVGPVSVDVFEAATARTGSASGRIDFSRQTVPLDVFEHALGLVKGIVLESGPLTPLKGWEVTLTQTLPSGRGLPSLATTSSIDGSYSFPGASEGTLTLRARHDGVNGSANAQTKIVREGQVVDVPLIVTIVKPLAGTVTGIVYHADGTPGANAAIEVCVAGDCNGTFLTTAGSDGTFSMPGVPLGRFIATARSQVTADSGSTIGELTADGQTVGVTIGLNGVTRISGTVRNADGSPAGGAKLELTGVPSSGCVGPCVQFALADGTFGFVDVPASTFTIVATGTIGGARGVYGDHLAPGESKTVTIDLAPFGSLSGTVHFPDGAPAPNILVDLQAGGRHLFAQTLADGTYAFASTPTGAFTATFTDPIGPGVGSRTGTIVGATTAGDVVLDTAPPVVTSVSPAPAATGVLQNAAVTITFSESIDPNTASASNITLSDGAAIVPGKIDSSDADRTVTFTPLSPLKDQTRYVLRVAGILDRVGKPIPAPYVTSFTTIDITPPVPLSIDPAPGASGVPLASTVRVKYSEVINPAQFSGPAIVVTQGGAAVAGHIDYAFGNTVVVFTPTRPLADATSYDVTRAAARDLAGNLEPAPVPFSFRTTDNTPPVLIKLSAPSTVIENTTATVTPVTDGSNDIAVVDYSINGAFVFSSRTSPFSMTFQANPSYGAPGNAIAVSAMATDTSGNRSTSAVSTSIAVAADVPPAVTLTASTPTNQLTAHNGDRVSVAVHATDDVGVELIGYAAQTGNPQDTSARAVAPAATDRVESFAFHVPADAVPGSLIHVDASARDTKKQTAAAAGVDILVLDSVAPAVSITGATTGTRVHPGQQTTVAVAAQDAGGVASITLTGTGVTQFVETRPVNPARPSAITSFTFTVPPNAGSTDSVTLVATAADAAGNIGTSPTIVLPVLDSGAPTVTLHTLNGQNDVAIGQTATVVAEASDDVSVARIDLTAAGAVTVSQSHAFSPAVSSGSAEFSFTVPAGLADGTLITLQATATDLAGNVSLPAPLTVVARTAQDVALPASVIVRAGEQATVSVSVPGGAAATLRVDLVSDNPAIATVTPFVMFAAGETSKTATVDALSGGSAQISASVHGVPRASMTASVIGGVISGFVTNDTLQPLAGVQVTVHAGTDLTTISEADGSYRVEGAIGPGVSVKAIDPATHTYGFATGAMSSANGFAKINVLLTTAASVGGKVFESDGTTPAGAGVRVDIYESNDMSAPRATTFTDDAGAYAFPFVQLGQYVIDATGQQGERGRAVVRLAVSAEDVDQPLQFLGQGTVVGHVFDAGGHPVAGAAVSFQAYSIFDTAPVAQRTTDASGGYRFESVLVGQFNLKAIDAATGTAGTLAGSVIHQGDTVTADVHLSAFAALAGTVYRADHQTTVAGATVVAGGQRSTTDSSGQYHFDIMPLGPVQVIVSDPGSRGRGFGSTTVTTAGQTQTLDIVLLAQGTVAVTVLDAVGSPVPNANVYLSAFNGALTDEMWGRTSVTGILVFDHVLSGMFSISADNGVLAGVLAPRPLGGGQLVQVVVQLQPTGSITGLVLDADGQTPVDGGTVYAGDVFSTTIKPDGTYRFENLPLTETGYMLKVNDKNGRLRAFTHAAVPLTQHGQVATQNFRYVGLGIVRGQVKYASNGTTAAGFAVTVQSLNPDFGGVRSETTDAAGFYDIPDVPVGAFEVSAGDLSLQLWGEGQGTVAHDGDIASVDILLQNNAIALPASAVDANNFTFDVQEGGSVNKGAGTFANAFVLDVLVDGAANRFTGGAVPTVEQNGREIVTRQNGLAGLNVTRKLFVPTTGYFARFLEIISNPTATPVTVGVQVSDGLASGVNVVASSSGDTLLSVDPSSLDRWAVVDDQTDGDPAAGGGLAAVGLAFDGEGGSVHASSAAVLLGSPLTARFAWSGITIPAGGTVAIMHFAAQQSSRAAAAASADRLSQLPPEALAGLSAVEIAAILNFAVPSNGVSALPSLPAVTGTISGHVYEADGSPIALARVFLKSANVFYGRTYQVSSDQTGAFSFASSFAADQAPRPVPLDGFTLRAVHPATSLQSPTFTGAFDQDATLATRDVTFTDTAVVTGVVRRHNGTAVTSGTVVVTGGTPQVSVTVAIHNDATYGASGLTAGAYTLTAAATHPQGTALTGTAAATLAAGDTAAVDITIQPTGTVEGTVTRPGGAAVPNATVHIDAAGFSRSTKTNTGGAFALPDIPEGVFSVTAVDPVTTLTASSTATVVRDQTSTVSLQFGATGHLDLQVYFAGGSGAPNAPVFLQEDSRGPAPRSIGVTDGSGHLQLDGLSAGAFVARATHPANARISATASGSLSTDSTTVSITIVLPAAATVVGTVADQNGPVSGIDVTVRSANPASGGFQTATTDATGRYVVAGVPGGPFTAAVEDFVRELFGETSGQVVVDGVEVTANISLTNDAIPLPVERYDVNEFWYHIDTDGRISSSSLDAFGPYWDSAAGGSRLQIIANGAGIPFTGSSVGTTEQEQREIVIRQQGLAGLNVTRKVFVPRDGYFARYLELLTNPTGTPITVGLQVDSQVHGLSQYPIAAIATSSGDAALDVTDPANPDRWATFDTSVVDESSALNVEPTAFVFDGPNAATRVSSVTLNGSPSPTFSYRWSSLTVNPGQTVGVMHFLAQQVSRAGAAAVADRLSQAPPEALAGLSPEEIAAVRNFALPADGRGTVAPLPPLTATITGRALSSDGVTGVQYGTLQYTSAHPIFGRTWTVPLDATGAFSLQGHIEDDWTSVPVPLGPYALKMTEAISQVQIAVNGDFNGTFAGNVARLATATASSTAAGGYGPQNAIDGDAGTFWMSNQSIALGSGAPWIELAFPAPVNVESLSLSTVSLLRARIDLLSATGQVIAAADQVDFSTGQTTVVLAGQAVRRIRVTDEADLSQIQIADLSVVGTAPELVAGVSRHDLVFTNAGTIAATVRRHNGAPATDGTIILSNADSTVYFQTSFSGGGYTFPAIKAGDYTLQGMISPQGAVLRGSATVTVINGATANVVVVIQPTGTVTGVVHRGNGSPAANSSVSLFGGTAQVSRFTTTDANGHYLLTDVPLGTMTLRATEPTTGAPTDVPLTLSAPDQTITQDVTLPGLGSVRVHVDFARGVPAANAPVFLSQAFPAGFFLKGKTDANGNLTITNILQGAFTVRAQHPLNNTFFSDVTGQLASDGDSPAATVSLPPVGSITGVVTLPTGAVVPFPTVSVLAGGTTYTQSSNDATGHYTFKALPVNQPLTVRAFWPSPNQSFYAETSATLAADNETQTINLRLPGLANIRVHVFTADGTTPMASARIDSNDWIRTFFQGRGNTDANGFLTLQTSQVTTTPEQFAEGAFTIRVKDPATGIVLATKSGAITLADAGTTVNVTITVGVVSGSITGRVLANDNTTPVSGSQVEVLNAADGLRLAQVTTGATGSYTFNNILAGPMGFIVRAHAPFSLAIVADHASAFVTAGETQQIDSVLPLTPGGVAGTVFAADGVSGIPNAAVTLLDVATSSAIASLTTNATGHYAVPNALVGASGFRVTVSVLSGRYTAQKDGTFAAGQTATVDLTIPVLVATITGVVTAADGATTVPSADLSLTDNAGSIITTGNTTADGTFTFGPLIVGAEGFRVRAVYGQASAEQAATAPSSGATVTVNISLPMSTVRGTVRFDDGTAVASPSVFATDADGRTYYPARTTSSGGYVFFEVPAGTLTVNAQDGDSGLYAIVPATLVDATASIVVDVKLPPSGTVTGRLLDSAGNPIVAPGTSVALTSSDLAFFRWTHLDANGQFTFTRVPVGRPFVQAEFWDGTAWRFVSASGDLAANQTLTLDLKWDGGGTVNGVILNVAGNQITNGYVSVEGYGASGPAGNFNWTANVTNGAFMVSGVPAGPVVVTATDFAVNGVATGVLSTGGTLTLNVPLGNAVNFAAGFSGADGFLYNTQQDGSMWLGGTPNGAYTYANALEMNGLEFPYLDGARVEMQGRQQVFGPVAIGDLIVSRKVFVPAVGGFARYLEIITNPTAAPIAAHLKVLTGLRGGSQVVVPPTATGNTYAVHAYDEIVCDCQRPSIAQVFQGSGSPAAGVSAIALELPSNWNLTFAYDPIVPPGATIVVMHFELQRNQADAAGASAASQALVALTDANALSGMSTAERAAVVNFVVPALVAQPQDLNERGEVVVLEFPLTASLDAGNLKEVLQ